MKDNKYSNSAVLMAFWLTTKLYEINRLIEVNFFEINRLQFLVSTSPKGYSITERRVPELIPVLGSQPAVTWIRGGGRSQKLRRHGGYRPLGLVWPCGSQQRRRRPAPCWGKAREGVAPPATRVRGCHPRENFEIANAKYCVLVHFF